MNILAVHNSYQLPGGEDQVFELETGLLEAHGHKVIRYQEHNDAVKKRKPLELVADTIWNRWSYRQLRTLIREGQVDIMHVHNTFPLISPACYYAATAERVPVVQTLHNYRLLCPSATFYREGAVCENCLGKTMPWPAVLHSCYRGSRAASATTAAMLTVHNKLHTWQNKVSGFVALTEFARNKFIEGGLPERKMFVKPNFVSRDPGMGAGDGDFALFLGRLTEEKGVLPLLDAWTSQRAPLPLEIAGDGPLAGRVAEAAASHPNIRWLGWQRREQIAERMRRATVVVIPSTWYESFPMAVVEAFAAGVPVIASELGSLASLIEHRRTGLHFEAGNAHKLAAQVEWVRTHPEEVQGMRREARREFEEKYTGDRNYTELMAIYNRLITQNRRAATEVGAAVSPSHRIELS